MQILTLTVVQGRPEGQVIPVRAKVFRIGRDADCQLRPMSADIAPRHCEIVQNGPRAMVRDLTGAGGTILNGQPVAKSAILEDGDVLAVGPLGFRVSVPKSAKVKAKAKAGSEPGLDDDDVLGWLDDDQEKPKPSSENTNTDLLRALGDTKANRRIDRKQT